MSKRTDISVDEIVERCMYPLVNEGYRAVESSGRALQSSLMDIVYVHGYGFPKHRGGVM